MSPIPNPRIIYAKVPTDYPVPGEHIVYEPDGETIDLENVPLNGGVLVKTLYLSVDPYMRGRMRDPKVPSYSVPFEAGKPGDGPAIVEVLRSESSKFKAGDHLTHLTGGGQWRAYYVSREDEAGTIIENPYNLPWSTFLSVAGPTAMTAFYSMWAFGGKPLKAGETIFVSTAAGGVGSIVVQIAKAAGLKVIGSTGDDEKVKYLKEELGVDVPFNYKKQSVWDVLKEHGPIDIYYDNVGGEQLDAALFHAAPKKSRFIMCGYASEYNLPPDVERYGVKNMRLMLGKSISMYGFIIWDLTNEYGFEPWVKEYLPLVKDGKIKQREQKIYGMENLAKGLVHVLKGENQGKVIIVVAED